MTSLMNENWISLIALTGPASFETLLAIRPGIVALEVVRATQALGAVLDIL